MPGTSEEFNRIVFYPEGSVPMSGQASLHYAFSRFADALTMLRQAKPLYLYWDSYTDGEDEVWWGMLATSKEPARA